MKTITNIFATATSTINFVGGNIFGFRNNDKNKAWDNGTSKGFHKKDIIIRD